MNSFVKISSLFLITAFLACISDKKNTFQLLDSMITECENHKGNDSQQYPLGIFTEQFYRSEAKFSETMSAKLSNSSISGLSEAQLISFELISLKLLKFILKDQIDAYKFERCLNPILSDAGFHYDLSCHAQPLYDS